MKKYLLLITLCSLILFSSVLVTKAALLNQDGLTAIGDQTMEFGADAGYNPDDMTPLPVRIGNIIQIALGFVGTLFLILIIVSGFQWMTAGGNATTIETAKKRIINSVVGLLIVLTAFTITLEVLNRTGDILTNN